MRVLLVTTVFMMTDMAFARDYYPGSGEECYLSLACPKLAGRQEVCCEENPRSLDPGICVDTFPYVELCPWEAQCKRSSDCVDGYGCCSGKCVDTGNSLKCPGEKECSSSLQADFNLDCKEGYKCCGEKCIEKDKACCPKAANRFCGDKEICGWDDLCHAYDTEGPMCKAQLEYQCAPAGYDYANPHEVICEFDKEAEGRGRSTKLGGVPFGDDRLCGYNTKCYVVGRPDNVCVAWSCYYQMQMNGGYVERSKGPGQELNCSYPNPSSASGAGQRTETSSVGVIVAIVTAVTLLAGRGM